MAHFTRKTKLSYLLLGQPICCQVAELFTLYKLPVPILEISVTSIRPYSKQANLLRRISLIIWGEVSMVPKQILGIIDYLIRDIFNVNTRFGRKTIVFGVNFKQVIPVARHGKITTIIEQNIPQSPMW